MEDVLGEIKSWFEVKPRFVKHKFTEILADGDLIVGKYTNVIFLISKEKIELSIQPLSRTVISLESGEGFKKFRFGEYKVEKADVEEQILKLNAEFSEELFYDLIPAYNIEAFKIEVTLRQCNLSVESISKEETEILKQVTRISESARSVNTVDGLENTLFEVSKIQMSFFKRFSTFKDINEEIFSSIVRFETLARKLDGWFNDKIQEFRDFHQSLVYYESKFEQTLNGIRDMYSLLSIQLDVMRNKENLELQRKTSSLQAAAVVIEFVAVLYYSLKIWEHFVDLEVMPKGFAFTILFLFTLAVVGYTEVLSHIFREKKISVSFILTTLILVLIILMMYLLPAFIFSGA